MRNPRPLPRTAVAAGLAAPLLAVLALAACAPRPDGPAPGTPAPTAASTPTPGPSATGEARARLEITFRADGQAAPEEYVLECTGAGPGPATTHPAPEAACENALALGAGFFTTAPDPERACTQQYGGPQTARVAGTLDGRAVDAEFSRTDGCEISRWDSAAGLLGPGGVDLPPDAAGPGAARP